MNIHFLIPVFDILTAENRKVQSCQGRIDICRPRAEPLLKANFSEDNTSVERCLAVAGLPARDALALLAGEGRDGGAVTVGAAALSKPLVHPRTGCPLAHPVTSAALGNSHCAQIVEIIIV